MALETMTLAEFDEQFNGAPIDLEELARYASTVDDDTELSEAAAAFLRSLDDFQSELAIRNIELG